MIYTFDVIPIKILAGIFVDIYRKAIIKILWINKVSRTAKTFFKYNKT